MYKSLSCGCVVEIELKGYGQTWAGVEIEYCPIHAAAPDLLEALEKIANYAAPDDYDRGGWVVAMETMQQLAAAAITLVKKPDDVVDGTLEKG